LDYLRKKILKKTGAQDEPKIDYFEIVKNTPKHLRKGMNMEEADKMIRDAHAEKLKKAS
jgi:hypothetical protein